MGLRARLEPADRDAGCPQIANVECKEWLASDTADCYGFFISPAGVKNTMTLATMMVAARK